jgi:hypothetical protein
MAVRGQGRAADPAAAVAWWLRAADRGYVPAQLALSRALEAGRGVKKDAAAAAYWAARAANGGGLP